MWMLALGFFTFRSALVHPLLLLLLLLLLEEERANVR